MLDRSGKRDTKSEKNSGQTDPRNNVAYATADFAPFLL